VSISEIIRTSWLFELKEEDQTVNTYEVILAFKVDKYERQYIVYKNQADDFELNPTAIISGIQFLEGVPSLLPITDEHEIHVVKMIAQNELK
jgi:hypothetical protein